MSAGGPSTLERLRRLGLALADGQLKRQAYRLAMLALLREQFDCSRTSLWRFSGQPGDLRLVCRASVGQGGDNALLGAELDQAQYGAYFAKLAREGVFACEDCEREPALAPLRAAYLDAQRVRALLDVSFDVNGRLYGVLCCEQAELPRAWRPAEIAALLRFGRMVSLQVARAIPDELRQAAFVADPLMLPPGRGLR